MNTETMKLLELLVRGVMGSHRLHAAIIKDGMVNELTEVACSELDAALAAVRDAEKPVERWGCHWSEKTGASSLPWCLYDEVGAGWECVRSAKKEGCPYWRKIEEDAKP